MTYLSFAFADINAHQRVVYIITLLSRNLTILLTKRIHFKFLNVYKLHEIYRGIRLSRFDEKKLNLTFLKFLTRSTYDSPMRMNCDSPQVKRLYICSFVRKFIT